MKPQREFHVVSWLDAALCSLQDALVHIDDLDCGRRRSDIKRAIGLVMNASSELKRFTKVTIMTLEAALEAGRDVLSDIHKAQLADADRHTDVVLGLVLSALTDVKSLKNS